MELDCSKYLSIDNGKGILINQTDARILDRHNINYLNCSNMSDLILIVGKYIDDNYDDELDDIEEVLIHLAENRYYNETKK